MVTEAPEKATGMLQHHKETEVEVEVEVELGATDISLATNTNTDTTNAATTTVSGGSASGGNSNATNSTGVFASIFASSSVLPSSQSSPASYSNLMCGVTGTDRNTTVEPMSLSLSSSLYRSTTAAPSLFPQPDQTLHHRQYVQSQQPALSATALLQKAAQMGATSSNTSFLHALGLAPSPPSSSDRYQEASISQWSGIQSKQERNEHSVLGLGVPSAGRDHLLMGPPVPTTLDFLGLGMGVGSGGSSGGYSAFLSSIGGSGLNVSEAAGVSFSGVQNKDWDGDSGDNKPALL